MKNVSESHFINTIIDDFALKPTKEVIIPIIKGNKIHCLPGHANSTTIVTPEGNYPYMLNEPWNPPVRNDSKLINAIHLKCDVNKTLEEVLKESKANVTITSAKICEGGGWYSKGSRYTYKDIYTEL